MAAVRREHVVVGPQRRARADRDRFMAGGQVRGALDEPGEEQVVRGLLGPADDRHLLVAREQFVGCHGVSPRPAAVFKLDWLSRSVFSAPPAVQYFRPATSRSSAGNLVRSSQPVAVTTTSSSIRAADQPSAAGQYVSSANTMPSASTSGCSSETSREKMGFSQIDRPTPCPYWRANAAISSGKPNSSARGQSATMSPVVTPGRTIAIAWSMYSRQRTYASRCAREALPTANVR